MEIYLLSAIIAGVAVLFWELHLIRVALVRNFQQIQENAMSLHSLSVLVAMGLLENGERTHVCGLEKDYWIKSYQALEVYTTRNSTEES